MSAVKKYLPAVLMILLGSAVGVLLIIDAKKLTEFVFRIFGAGLIVLSIIMVIRYLIARKHDEESPMMIFTAIIAFVFGMVLAIGARWIVEAGSTLCAIFYGAVMMVNGILKISEYFSIKKRGASASGLLIFSGILSIGLGVATLVLCNEALNIIGLIIGITLIVGCVLDIAALVAGRRIEKRIGIYDTAGDDSDYEDE